MAKTNLHIQVARSSRLELSSMSLVSSAAIMRTLRQSYARVEVSTVNNLQDLKQLVAKRPDIVFMGLKFVYEGDQKIWVSDYLEAHGIAHTGSPRPAIEFEQSKPLAKQCVINAGLASSAFTVVEHGCFPGTIDDLVFPLFVKPSNLGGGSGVDDKSIVYTADDLQAKLRALFAEYSSDVLIEEYLPGREFSVGVLNNGDELLAMPIEMKPSADANGNKILSLALKSGVLETPVSAVTDKTMHKQLSDFALNVFEVLGARDYGRIDIRLDADGVPHFLEANLIPGLIKGSGNFTKACLINQGIDHEEMLLRIVQLAEARIFAPNLLKSSGTRAVVAQW
ncbi:MAG: D-alanine-D-alanine ligase [Patescibacteria group bacterium]|nr:D-alanine-D-alanine ligase [Patescibacteria group bacterium]